VLRVVAVAQQGRRAGVTETVQPGLKARISPWLGLAALVLAIGAHLFTAYFVLVGSMALTALSLLLSSLVWVDACRGRSRPGDGRAAALGVGAAVASVLVGVWMPVG
jgi:hypothetical protein